MTRYELLYIIPTTFTDEEVGGVETKIGALITKYGATVESTKRLGKFRLTYPIKKQRHGHYVMVMFTAEHPSVAKIEESLRIAPDVVRHLILRADEAGSDQKFELVQFAEVVVETRDDRNRRREQRTSEVKEGPAKEELKAGVAAIEGKTDEATVVAPKESMSSEELDKKIDTALSGDAKEV